MGAGDSMMQVLAAQLCSIAVAKLSCLRTSSVKYRVWAITLDLYLSRINARDCIRASETALTLQLFRGLTLKAYWRPLEDVHSGQE